MADEEWVSDTDTVDGDTFNKANFNAVDAASPDDGPELVRSTAKPDFIQVQVKPSSNVPPPAAAPSTTAAEIEAQHIQEDYELQQARQIQQSAPVPPPKTDVYEAPVPAPVTAVAPVVPPMNRKASKNVEGAERFQGKYDDDIIEFFNKMNEKSFTEQAVEYLNAYWDEIGDQAEFIFSVAHKVFTEADMHRQGITLYYKYDEGSNVDYPTYLYFYEKLVKFVSQNPQWRQGQYEKSAVYEVKTAIKHKKDLQEKVDVNFDGKISFLEYLLYQYNTFSNPAQFMERSRMAGDEHPAILAARLALEDVNARIKAYEEERARLEEGAKLPGVQGLTFKHQLAVLDSSPLAEELNKALITAEAAVRMAVRKFQGSVVAVGAGGPGFTPRGALWWMQRDLEEKQKYQRNKMT